MTANTTPIFPITPKISWGVLTTANIAMTGSGATLFYTAGSNGGRVDEIRIMATGSNSATAVRIFVNNGSANTTITNNTLIYDYTIASTTLANNAAMAMTVILPTNLVLPANYQLQTTTGTAVTGIQVVGIGGDY